MTAPLFIKDHYLRENGAVDTLSDVAVPLCPPGEMNQEIATLSALTPRVPNILKHLAACLDVRQFPFVC